MARVLIFVEPEPKEEDLRFLCAVISGAFAEQDFALENRLPSDYFI